MQRQKMAKISGNFQNALHHQLMKSAQKSLSMANSSLPTLFCFARYSTFLTLTTSEQKIGGNRLLNRQPNSRSQHSRLLINLHKKWLQKWRRTNSKANNNKERRMNQERIMYSYSKKSSYLWKKRSKWEIL